MASMRTPVDLGWQERARCRGQGTGDFFPAGEEEGVARVVEICRGCPVRVTCLAFALRHREPGLWAATTTHKRKEIRRHRCERCGLSISWGELARHHLQRALEWRCSACGGVRVVRKAPDPRATQVAQEAALRAKARWSPDYTVRRRNAAMTG
jgi:WhiB family transcriptional regulator, redox-sensing transcriptional regulator